MKKTIFLLACLLLLAASPGDLKFTGALKNGLSIELLGVSEYPSAGKAWWAADGTPLPAGPYDHMDMQVGAEGKTVREVALRMNIGDASMMVRDMPWTSVSDRNNKNIDGIDAVVLELPPNASSGTLHIDIGTGAWQSVTSCGSEGGVESIGNQAFVCSSPFIVNKQTHYILSSVNDDLTKHAEKLVVTDQSGKEVPAYSVSTNEADTAKILAMEIYVAVPPQSIAKIELQQRPYDKWIEFRNIALDPGGATKFTVATSDDSAAK